MKKSPQKDSAIEAAAAHWIARRDAGLSSSEKAEFERWRKADPRNDQALTRYDQIWAILDRPMKGGRADAMVLELNQRQRVRRRRTLGIAGACCAILLLGLVLWRKEPGIELARPNTFATSAVVLQPEKRVLPDGSVVELNAGAEISLDFSGTYRRIALKKGEAHFDVTKNPLRPFIVTAGAVDFRAVGTAFAVQLSASQVELLVTQGRVAVEKNVEAMSNTHDSEAQPPSAATVLCPTVEAGNLIHIELAPQSKQASPEALAVTADEMARRLSWRSTRLELTGTPLLEAVALMNRYNRVQFVISDPSLANVEVSGYFRADNTEAFLLLLEQSLGVQAERSDQTITLRRAP